MLANQIEQYHLFMTTKIFEFSVGKKLSLIMPQIFNLRWREILLLHTPRFLFRFHFFQVFNKFQY